MATGHRADVPGGSHSAQQEALELCLRGILIRLSVPRKTVHRAAPREPKTLQTKTNQGEEFESNIGHMFVLVFMPDSTSGPAAGSHYPNGNDVF